MLGVGIDWAEEFHLVALGRPDNGVFEVSPGGTHPGGGDCADGQDRRVGAGPGRGAGGDRDQPRDAGGADAGRRVHGVPVNPDLIARRRGPARKKDDAEDARIACLLALDRFASLRPMIPHGAVAAELRAIARDDERANRDERRLLNRLRADLIATFPAAMTSPVTTWAGPRSCGCWNAGPPRKALRQVPREKIDGARPGRPPRLAGPLRRPGHRRVGQRNIHGP